VRSDHERLLDILEAIEKVEQRKALQKPDFDADEMLQVWTVHYLQIIGEAASRISPELRSLHPEIPWGQIIGMRHVLVHGYFDIDLDIVWMAIDVNLPELKNQVLNILSRMDPDNALA
jgi:uncharacterized protein with HEPN domain